LNSALNSTNTKTWAKKISYEIPERKRKKEANMPGQEIPESIEAPKTKLYRSTLGRIFDNDNSMLLPAERLVLASITKPAKHNKNKIKMADFSDHNRLCSAVILGAHQRPKIKKNSQLRKSL
jgi:hypothetical protein